MAFTHIPEPEPGPGEVLIANRSSSLNFFDILQIQGKYQVKPPLPFTPVAEVAGTVDRAGAGVTRFRPGDRVVAYPFGGGLAEKAVARESVAFHIPDEMPFAEAAAMPIVYQTSFFALRDRARLQPGEWLLVHAGASGVGMAAIQLGKAWGARVIATASTEEKLQFAMAHGAEHGVLYNDASWVERVKEITGGRGADVIYDPVGGDVFDLSTKCIAPFGRLLVVGFASGRIPTVAANRVLLKNISIVGVLWGNHVAAVPAYGQATHDELVGMFLAGQIRPVIHARYPLDRAVEALRSLSGRTVLGKVVIEF